MSFRAWMFTVAIGLIITALAWFSWCVFSAYQQNQANERADAAQYYSETSEHSPIACRSVMDERGLFDWLTCLAENVSTDTSKKQAEYDLKAQQEMAAWAFGMLIVTMWLTIITFSGVLFVWQTLKATQEMSKDATRIGEVQTRGYLSIVAGNATLRTDQVSANLHNAFSLTFKNFGVTPIKAEFSDVKMRLSPTSGDPIDIVFHPEEIMKEFGGSDEDTIRFVNCEGHRLSELGKSADDLAFVVHLFIFVVTTDIFDRKTNIENEVSARLQRPFPVGDFNAHFDSVRVTKVERQLQN